MSRPRETTLSSVDRSPLPVMAPGTQFASGPLWQSSRMAGNGRPPGRRFSSEKILQPRHLLTALELNHLVGDQPIPSFEREPKVAREKHKPAHNERAAPHLINCAEQLPQRMAPQQVILLAEPETD